MPQSAPSPLEPNIAAMLLNHGLTTKDIESALEDDAGSGEKSGLLINDKGAIYVGGIKDGKKHGYGINIRRDGSIYDGDWKDDVRHGYGITKNADRSRYIGYWEGGQKHGHGCNIYKSGAEYTGYWKAGKRHGQGFYSQKNKDGKVVKKIGNWKDGKNISEAIISPEDTSKKGGASASSKSPEISHHGGENLIEMDKATRSQYNREHTIILAEGIKYTGDWKEGRIIHGHGVMTFADGGKYTGDWESNEMHGHGTKTFPDGSKYTGDWKDGEMHGHGVITSPDGREYIGDWQDSKISGHGVMIFPDGSKQAGNWQNDKSEGRGISINTSGHEYIGNFKEGSWGGAGNLGVKKTFYKGVFKKSILTGVKSLKEGRNYTILLIMSDTQLRDHPNLSDITNSFYDDGTTVKYVDEEVAKDLKIEDYLCFSKDEEHKQVIVHISDHGDESGKSANQDRITALLDELTALIDIHNKTSEAEGKIKRIKLRLSMGHGDNFVTKSQKFISSIKKLNDIGVDVHTSAIEGSSISIMNIGNGKYNSSSRSAATRIVKRIFPAKDSPLIASQMEKYKDYLKKEDGTLIRSETYPNATSFLSDISEEKKFRNPGILTEKGIPELRKVDNGETYLGPLDKNGKPNGCGMLFSTGSTHIGQFENGNKSGKFIHIDDKGNRHEGYWEKGVLRDATPEKSPSVEPQIRNEGGAAAIKPLEEHSKAATSQGAG